MMRVTKYSKTGRWAIVGIAATFVTIAVRPAKAQTTDLPERIRGLNNQVLQLHGQTRSREFGLDKRHEAREALQERAVALAELIATNPGEALSLAFSNEASQALAAAFPDAGSLVETSGEWRGSLECVIFDDGNLREDHVLRRMVVGDLVYSVYVGREQGEGLQSGPVRVKGVRLGNLVAASSVEPAAGEALACSTTGVQNTAVILVTWGGMTPPVTPAAVYDVFFGTTARSLSGYWQEASYGRTSAAGNVFGWYTLPNSYACSDYANIRAAAIAAADRDVVFSNYTRLFIVFPSPGGCSYAGYSSIGCATLSSADGSFTASTSWLLAENLVSNNNGVMTSAHEGGHGLGLNHSRSRSFGTEALGPVGASGTVTEYGDNFSPMGEWNLGHYAVQQKVQLGWMSNVTAIQSNGTFTLQPVETAATGIQALQIQRGTGNNAWIWLEYRQPIGNYDPALGTRGSQVFSGALVHYQDSFTGTYTNLLDFTPTSGSAYDPALAAGRTWVDPYTNLTISVQSATSSGLNVAVNYGAVPCTTAAPTVSASPSNPSGIPGANVSYVVTITNNSSAGCPSASFSLGSSNPSGWATTFSPSTVTLSPGESGSVTMIKTIPAGTSSATYAVSATAANSSSSGSGTANCTVLSPPAPISIMVLIPNGVYSNRTTVPISANVLSGTAPAASATVTLTVTNAKGARSSKTVTTSSTGSATWSYKINQNDPKGTYTVTASASYGGQSANANAVSFTVQ